MERKPVVEHRKTARIQFYRPIDVQVRSDSASARGMNKKLNSTITPVLKVQRDPRNKSVPITSPFFNPL